MAKTFDAERLREAYNAGFKDGLYQCMCPKRRSGWRHVKNSSELRKGEIVKTVEATISGWRGYGEVLAIYEESVLVLKVDKAGEDRPHTATLLVYQVMQKVFNQVVK